jgi:hypothetical protein
MINEVRNSVLAILNKNNYGYVSPSDFNLMAANAQMEIYESYFTTYNKTTNAENLRSSGSAYADVKKPLAEVLEGFLMSDFIIPKNSAASISTNNFYYPSITTVGSSAYMINKVIAYTKQLASGDNSTLQSFALVDSAATFITNGVSVGDIVVNLNTFKSSTVVSVVSQTRLNLNDNIFLAVATDEDYSVYSASNYAEAEKVSNSNILMLLNSIHTAPSLIYPAYTNIGDLITLYPSTIKGYGAVRTDYFRHPKTPKWTFISLSGGEPVFDQSQLDYQDFELPAEDAFKLVTKILEYCGIIIRETEVTQFGMVQQQQTEATFGVQ